MGVHLEGIVGGCRRRFGGRRDGGGGGGGVDPRVADATEAGSLGVGRECPERCRQCSLVEVRVRPEELPGQNGCCVKAHRIGLGRAALEYYETIVYLMLLLDCCCCYQSTVVLLSYGNSLSCWLGFCCSRQKSKVSQRIFVQWSEIRKDTHVI